MRVRSCSRSSSNWPSLNGSETPYSATDSVFSRLLLERFYKKRTAPTRMPRETEQRRIFIVLFCPITVFCNTFLLPKRFQQLRQRLFRFRITFKIFSSYVNGTISKHVRTYVNAHIRVYISVGEKKTKQNK